MWADLRLPAWLAAAALAGGPVQAACGPVGWHWHAGAVHSRWQEHADSGRRLVLESGTLATLSGQAAVACGSLRWEAQLGLADGRRGYRGEGRGEAAGGFVHRPAGGPVSLVAGDAGAHLVVERLGGDDHMHGKAAGRGELFGVAALARTGAAEDQVSGHWMQEMESGNWGMGPRPTDFSRCGPGFRCYHPPRPGLAFVCNCPGTCSRCSTGRPAPELNGKQVRALPIEAVMPVLPPQR